MAVIHELTNQQYDQLIKELAGPEPPFDTVTRDFLVASLDELGQRCSGAGSLIEFQNLGEHVPWLYRLTLATAGFACEPGGMPVRVSRHVFVVRFMSDCLRRTDPAEMIHLLAPRIPPPFHPNIHSSGQCCIEIYPGETLTEIATSLHNLVRWRLRQFDERDALNPAACAWGRENVHEPIDDRPLFGRRLKIELQSE